MLVVREELEGFLGRGSFSGGGETAATASQFQGRSRLTAVTLADGTSALVRAYHRGGMVRYLTRDLFCTWPPRPFVELATTERARQRGVSTLEVVAACIERTCGPFYRGWLVTRELARAKDLWEALHDDRYTVPDRRALLMAVAASVRRMHLEGVYHRDLNLKNILIRQEGEAIRAYIIDLDKAELFRGVLAPPKIKRNLERLCRSARKLDPAGRWLSREELDWFRSFYQEVGIP